MVHGYHVIFGTYGFWLPNDPRGSWSDFVGSWELVRFGRATKSLARKELTPTEEAQRLAAKQALQYPPVQLTGIQARAVGTGFATACRKSGLTIWACSILPEHVHAVVARHRFKVEYIVGLLKGEATKQLKRERIHPLAAHALGGSATAKASYRSVDDGPLPLVAEICARGQHSDCLQPATVPTPWADRCWRVFLDSEQAIGSAVHYVNENPIKEGKPLQTWSFITPFAGIATSGWTTYH